MSMLTTFAGFTAICEPGQKFNVYSAKLLFWVGLALFIGTSILVIRNKRLPKWAKILIVPASFAVIAVVYLATAYLLIGGLFTSCDPNPFSTHWNGSDY
jgi:TctA family transporter